MDEAMLESPRSSGLFLHPSSLPGRYGMGEIGPEAQHWLTVMSRLGITDWEMHALGPTPVSGLPQDSLSDFAGNPLLISFDALRLDGVLLQQDVTMLPHFSADHVDSAACAEVRSAFLRLAAQRLLAQSRSSPLLGHAFESFCDREAGWLDDWALYAALRDEQAQMPWREWPNGLAEREPMAMANAMVRLDSEIDEHRALQFLFARQWLRLRAQAHAVDVRLIVEIPTRVAAESADAWACPSLLTDDGSAEFKSWWAKRLEHHLNRADLLRVRGGPLPVGMEAALLESYHAPLPLITEETGKHPPNRMELRDMMGSSSPADEASSVNWRFSWDALTSDVEAKLAAFSTTALCHATVD
jgi:4-alpha-glucanotransferase